MTMHSGEPHMHVPPALPVLQASPHLGSLLSLVRAERPPPPGSYLNALLELAEVRGAEGRWEDGQGGRGAALRGASQLHALEGQAVALV